MAITLSTTNDFNREVLSAESGLVLVDFWATRCGPCRVFAPILEELAQEYQDTLKIVKVDVDKFKDLVISYGITSIPTILVFKDGTMVEQPIQGVLPKEVFQEVIDAHLS